jgi:predicted negative regulator of RcsB-dependent stress response
VPAAKALLTEGQALLAQGKFRDALEAFPKALQKLSVSPDRDD